jgi:phosphoglycerol transferase MdoB-like AlkP superfamily enzyme
MDRLASEEGLLFTNIYASGNRTVRGFEGVLSSFPPLPGDSIVKRDRSQNVETIARILKRDGYQTIFLYGGRGLFDGMRSYALNNGYDRFIEQKHFEHPTFKTIWGVCDEDTFQRAIEEFRALSATGKPFCGTILSVSNHKPSNILIIVWANFFAPRERSRFIRTRFSLWSPTMARVSMAAKAFRFIRMKSRS